MAKNNFTVFGEKIQDYEVLNLLGKGGFSTVYRAKCHKTSLEVAIKMIEKKVMQKEGLVERIRQEVAIHSRLKHPAILELYTFFEDSNYVYLVLELCRNGELLNYFNENGSIFSEKKAKSIMKQVVNGVIYLHSHKILHRDIKLSNILLADNMQIKIADFGLATQMQYSGDRHITMCGTPNYISPEVVSHKSHGLEVDLWALGCLLYIMLVGKPPFETDTITNTLSKVITAEYQLPNFLSAGARDLITRLLQKNPYERMSLSEILDHPFMNEKTQKWSRDEFTDSGFDTITTCSSNGTHRLHSLDRKSNTDRSINDYETPKISRRSRSFDRCLPSKQENQTNDFNLVFNEMSLVDHHSDRIKHDCNDIIYPDKVYQTGIFSNGNLTNSRPEKMTKTNWLRRNSSENDIYCNAVKTRQQGYRDRSGKCVERRSNFHLVSCCSKNSPNDSEGKCSYSCSSDKIYSTTKFGGESVKNYRECTGGVKMLITESLSPVRSLDNGDRIQVKPFNTDRLKPTRQRSKNVILSILKNGDVSVEFVKNRSRTKQDIVVEVCRISSNGLRMSIYYPNGGKGVAVSDTLPSMPQSGADAVFNCETLSRENWKKYTYASRFVEMVQAKTPKITLYTEEAKCVLMENKPEPDFEVTFYQGTKITRSRKGITLTDNNGVVSVLTDTGQKHSLHPCNTELYDHFEQYYNHCCVIEEKLSSIGTASSKLSLNVYPVIIGRKPTDKQSEPDIGVDSRSSISNNHYRSSAQIFHSTEYSVR